MRNRYILHGRFETKAGDRCATWEEAELQHKRLAARFRVAVSG